MVHPQVWLDGTDSPRARLLLEQRASAFRAYAAGMLADRTRHCIMAHCNDWLGDGGASLARWNARWNAPERAVQLSLLEDAA